MKEEVDPLGTAVCDYIDSDDTKLAEILARHNLAICKCGKQIDRVDVAWNNAETESGTSCCSLEIICQACGDSVLHMNSWWPWIDSFNEFVEVLEGELK